MNKFQIIQNVARKARKVKPTKVKKSVNYLAIPFKEMKAGDCVLVKEKGNSSDTKHCVKVGVRRALAILEMNEEDFLVDWTKDKKHVAIWRLK